MLLAQLADRKEVSELTDECDRFCKYVSRIIGVVVTIGIGPVCENISELSESYSGAREAVSYRVLYGASRAINMQEIAPKEITRQGFSNDAELSNLFKMIRLSSQERYFRGSGCIFAKTFFTGKIYAAASCGSHGTGECFVPFWCKSGYCGGRILWRYRGLYGKLMEMEPEMLGKWLKQISLVFQEKIIHARSIHQFLYCTGKGVCKESL